MNQFTIQPNSYAILFERFQQIYQRRTANAAIGKLIRKRRYVCHELGIKGHFIFLLLENLIEESGVILKKLKRSDLDASAHPSVADTNLGDGEEKYQA
jgi:hypothetical protein